MKQFLFLVVLGVVIYLVLWGGTTNVLHQADINPKKLISNIATGINENAVPNIDPARTGFRFADARSYNRIKENAFMTYDSDVCSSFVDLVYSSGYRESEPLVKEYFSMFMVADDLDKVLNILGRYKDKQTLNLLLAAYKDENMVEKISFLKALSVYHTPEVAKIIKEATLVEDDLLLAETAQKLEAEFANEKWYREGLKDFQNSGNGLDMNMDFSVNKNHLGQQYHSGSDFENKMTQY